VTYFDDSCVIEDRTSRILLRSGEQRDRVYYYKDSLPRQVNAVDARCLWHRRLGHPSNEGLSLLPHSLGVRCKRGELKDERDICFLAKQTHNSFPISKHNATNVFDLILCDIWGPYRTVSLYGAQYFLSIIDDGSRAT